MASLNPLVGVLGRRKAAHLLRRTSYRLSRAKVDELSGLTAADALISLLNSYPLQLDQPVYSDGVSAPIPWVNPPNHPVPPFPATTKISHGL